MAKDRLNLCIYYVCKGETCKKGFKDVDSDEAVKVQALVS